LAGDEGVELLQAIWRWEAMSESPWLAAAAQTGAHQRGVSTSGASFAAGGRAEVITMMQAAAIIVLLLLLHGGGSRARRRTLCRESPVALISKLPGNLPLAMLVRHHQLIKT
jgi:hypothetical protein